VIVFRSASRYENKASDTFCDGFAMRLNPRSSGSCHFMSVSDQLSAICGKSVDHDELRRQYVNFLESNPTFTDGQMHSINFVLVDRNNDSDSSAWDWEQYLSKMRKPSTYGDNIMLQAMLQFLNVQFLVASKKGNQVTVHILKPTLGYSDD